ncbi:MAG: hypothetical protein R2831_08515 [Chitinophagaceae bacterium]
MNILIIYYSQSGQLKSILDSISEGFPTEVSIDYAEIVPEKGFSLPWSTDTFFDCMPECVLEIPEPIKPMKIANKNYDLIIVGYQPWFLSPSLPITSFLKSEYASILKNKNIVTVVGSRNMWLNAQEKIKASLKKHSANLLGNIVLFDRHPNVISLLTVMRWTFKGQKEASKWLPEAGISQKDILEAKKYGKIIFDFLNKKESHSLQKQLLEAHAVEMKPSLIILEKRGIKNFRKFARYIHEKGSRGSLDRLPRVRLFKRLLTTIVFILSPISNLTAQIQLLLQNRRLREETNYFKEVSYKENAI